MVHFGSKSGEQGIAVDDGCEKVMCDYTLQHSNHVATSMILPTSESGSNRRASGSFGVPYPNEMQTR